MTTKENMKVISIKVKVEAASRGEAELLDRRGDDLIRQVIEEALEEFASRRDPEPAWPPLVRRRALAGRIEVRVGCARCERLIEELERSW